MRMNDLTERRIKNGNHSSSILKYLRSALGLAIVVYLAWYLARKWPMIAGHWRFGVIEAIELNLLFFLGTLPLVRVTQLIFQCCETQPSFLDLLFLHHFGVMLNYAPMKAGTFFRAAYLRRHYGLSYTLFSAFFLYLSLLMVATSTGLGLAVLLSVYGLREPGSKILAGALFAACAVSWILLLSPVRQPRSDAAWASLTRQFLSGRQTMMSQKRKSAVMVMYLALSFTTSAVRLMLIYDKLQLSVNPAAFLVLGGVAYLMTFLSLTPGSLGIRELLLGVTGSLLGVPQELAILAAMVDRAVIISYAFVLGGLSALWIWRRDASLSRPPDKTH